MNLKLILCRREDRQPSGKERWPECAEQDVLHAGQEAELLLCGDVIRARCGKYRLHLHWLELGVGAVRRELERGTKCA